MFAIQTKTSFFSFLSIFLLALAVSINLYLFLHFKLHPLDDHHLMAGFSTAMLSILLFAPLVSHIRYQAKGLNPELEPATIIPLPYPPPSSETTKTNLIAVCASCKDIRDSEGIWRKVEEYIPHHHGDRCTHSICQECQQKLYPRFTR